MSLSIGIVGLPNVGKSTLFNALVRARTALAANYPFATVDPNVGIVEVPDERIKKLAAIDHPEKLIPAAVEFHDIAGLVKGASTGEGLGNQFLAHIRECDAIAQVVRVFTDSNVIHVHGNVDPARDIDIIKTELILADLQTLDRRLQKARSEAKSGKAELITYAALLERIHTALGQGTLARDVTLTDEERPHLNDLHLLTQKPIMYIANVDEAALAAINPHEIKKICGLTSEKEHAADQTVVVPISAKIEEELIDLSPEESAPFLKEIGIDESGLNKVIKEAYRTLNLITYFTSGPMETRAWTIVRGTKAPQAAGVIHTDFEKGFIRAEVIAYEDYIAHNGVNGAKENGKLRLEGKDYVVNDGDVMHFRFSS